MKEGLDAIFFDVGDTLVFDEPSMSSRIVSALGAIGAKASEAQIQAGLRLAEDYVLPLYVEGIDTESPEIRRQAMEAICRTAEVRMLDDSAWEAFAKAYDGVEFARRVHPEAWPLLEFLSQQDVHLGIISDWDANLPSLLSELGIAEFFQSFSVSELVGAHKPSAALFQHALGYINTAPDRALHIGDFYELDYVGARSVGMRALLFDWRNRVPLPDVTRVASFSELTKSINEMFQPR